MKSFKDNISKFLAGAAFLFPVLAVSIACAQSDTVDEVVQTIEFETVEDETLDRPVGEVDREKEAKCYSCHGGDYAKWMKGPHANFQYVDDHHQRFGWSDLHTSYYYPTDYTKFIGYPNAASIEASLQSPSYAGKTAKYCTDCHGPSTIDNSAVKSWALLDSAGVVDTRYEKQVERKVIGCDTCHGNTQNHVRAPLVNKVTSAAPDASKCASCHGDNFPSSHLKYHPNSKDIYAKYASSKHTKSINSHTWADENTKTSVRGRCSKCHTDEGARKYGKINGDYTELRAQMDSKADINNPSAVQCRTCHNAHNPKDLMLPASENRSAEFNTCTSCHQLLPNTDMTNIKPTTYVLAYHDPAVNKYGAYNEVITDTHWDYIETTTIEGYAVNPADEHACTACHDPHGVDNTINIQWTSSSHGNLGGEAWVHYDFKGSNRSSCQKCHTSTGFKNFVADMTNYNASNNSFSHLQGEQREVLNCDACHTAPLAVGTRRTVKQVTPDYETYGATHTTTSVATFPDVGDSNACLVCHGGRGSGQGVTAAFIGATTNGSHFGSFNPHYLPAAGTLFSKIGYHFDGQTYENKSYFAHDTIGTSSSSSVPGSNGPCASCHMGDAKSHTFKVVDSGAITSQATCNKCHDGEHVLAYSDIEHGKTGYKAALEVIKTLLANKGIHYNAASGYPYVFSSATSQNFGTAYNSWTDERDLGATFNLALLDHEPGGFAHNRYYVKKLIFDTINWLDNGVMDETIDLSAYTDAGNWLKGSNEINAIKRP